MLSVVSLPNHTFTGQASSSKWLTSIMHSFARKKKNHVVNSQKLMRNNPNLVRINAYAKFGLIPSIHSQDIEQNGNSADNQGS